MINDSLNVSRKPAALLLLVTLTAGLFLTMLPLAPASGQEEPKYGGTMVVALWTTVDPVGLNPILAPFEMSLAASTKVFSKLVDLDANGKVHGELAESWVISSDGTTYTFKLRNDVTWHDGEEFTSADVKYTYDLYLEPDNPNGLPYAYLWEPFLASVDAPDDYTVVLTLKDPFSPFLTLTLAHFRGPYILPEHIYAGTDITENEANWEPIGTGPFKFSEMPSEDTVKLVRNENYWKKDDWGRSLPYLDGIIFQHMAKTEAQLLALEAGEVHAIPWFVGIPEKVAYEKKPGITGGFHMPATQNNMHAWFNYYDNEFLSDLEVRKAILHAIDRDKIIDVVMLGQAERLDSFIPVQDKIYYKPSFEIYDYNPDKANSILDAAGYEKGADGVRFTIRHIYQALAVKEKIGLIMKEDLAKVGINLTLEGRDWPSLAGDYFGPDPTFDWDIGSTLFLPQGPEPDGSAAFYHPDNVPPAGANGLRWTNAEFGELWDQTRKASGEERVALFHKMQDIYASEVPEIPLYGFDEPLLTSSEFHIFDEGILQGWGFLSNLEKVWWEKGTTPAPSDDEILGTDLNTVGAIIAIIAVVVIAGAVLAMRKQKQKKA